MKLVIYGKLDENVLSFFNKEQIIFIDDSLPINIPDEIEYVICLDKDIDRVNKLVEICKLHNKGILFFICIFQEDNIEELASNLLETSKCLNKKSMFFPTFTEEQVELYSVMAFISTLTNFTVS